MRNQRAGGGYAGRKGHQGRGQCFLICILLSLCHRQEMMSHMPPSSSFLTVCIKGHFGDRDHRAVCACARMFRFAVKSLLTFPSVRGVDEPPPRRAGRAGCHGLQVCPH